VNVANLSPLKILLRVNNLMEGKIIISSLQNLLDPPFHPVTLADKHRFMSGDVCGCKEKGRDYNECAHLLKCCWNVCLKI